MVEPDDVVLRVAARLRSCTDGVQECYEGEERYDNCNEYHPEMVSMMTVGAR